jgi:hypothetical protein
MIINWNGIINPENNKLVDIYYDQNRNSIEEMIRKIKAEYKNAILNALKSKLPEHTYKKVEKIIEETLKGFLESCGMATFMMLMEGLAYLGYFNYPYLYPSEEDAKNKTNGKMIQMDDWGMCYQNDPKFNDIFTSGNVMDNRVMKNYVTLAWELFRCKAGLIKNPAFDFVQHTIKKGNGVMLCKIDPGHYIGCGAIKGDTILYKDSWIKENTVLTREEFNNNIVPYCVVFYKKPVAESQGNNHYGVKTAATGERLTE